MPEVPPRIVLIVLRFLHSFYDSTLFTLVETFAHGPFLISFGFEKRMHGFGILKLNSCKNLSISIFYFILEFADIV